MYARLYTAAVLLFWLASTTWLVQAKVWPALQRGTPPDYRQEFATLAEDQPAVGWEMFWNNRPVGFAISRAYGTSNEPQEIRSYVRFENMKLKEVLQELLGGMSFLTSSLLGSSDFELNLGLATELRMDWDGDLHSFQTSIKAEDNLDLLFLRGQRTEQERLRIAILTGNEPASATSPLIQEFALPAKTHFSDAFSPRSRMVGLSVGQKWTTPVVTPIATTQSVRLVEARVEKKEKIHWSDRDCEAFVVAYRNDNVPGDTNRQPAGYAWVRDDGFVMRQELTLGTARIRFERLAEGPGKERAAILESGKFERYVHRQFHQAGAKSLELKPDDASSAAGARHD